MMWARFVAQQDLATVLRCHVAAFEALGGVPQEILYDRMRTAVLGEVDDRGIVYNDKLLALAGHYGFVPRACRPYRAKTKGKVERPFRYVREDFFLAGRFRNLDDLNAQFTQWLDQVANRRLHGTTGEGAAFPDRPMATRSGRVGVAGEVACRRPWNLARRAAATSWLGGMRSTAVRPAD